jgi:hypothetical protein
MTLEITRFDIADDGAVWVAMESGAAVRVRSSTAGSP